MALRLTITSHHASDLGERGTREFGHAGGTIGRSLESDWVLPDAHRFMSSRHASIDFRSGSYYIIDTSTNGVFVNGAEKPVGRGKPQRLFSKDRVRIGDYEMVVEIDEADTAMDNTYSTPYTDPVDAKQRVDAPDPTAKDLVDAYEITGVGIEMLLDEEDSVTLHPGKPAAPGADRYDPSALALEESMVAAVAHPALDEPTNPDASAAARAAVKKKPAPAAKRKRAAAPAKTPADSPLDAFFRGAGMSSLVLDAGEADQLLHTLGQVMRELIVGLTENLYLRSAQKNALRQPNTTIQPADNNPLKFSATVDEALNNLLFKQSEQYLPPVEAVRGAFGDLKLHQIVMLRALEAALDEFVGRLDPDRVEEKLAAGKAGALRAAANKLKFWDLYRDLYQVVTQHPAGELPRQFTDEYSRAYEEQLNRLRPQVDSSGDEQQANAG